MLLFPLNLGASPCFHCTVLVPVYRVYTFCFHNTVVSSCYRLHNFLFLSCRCYFLFQSELLLLIYFWTMSLDRSWWENTSFRSSGCHLVTGAKSYVWTMSVNPTNLVLWSEALLVIWYDICLFYHVCLFLITRPLVHHKNKSNSLETRLRKDISIKPYSQTLTAKYKGLTVKVETKYLLTNWFSE